jgi:hypothetical protein
MHSFVSQYLLVNESSITTKFTMSLESSQVNRKKIQRIICVQSNWMLHDNDEEEEEEHEYTHTSNERKKEDTVPEQK